MPDQNRTDSLPAAAPPAAAAPTTSVDSGSSQPRSEAVSEWDTLLSKYVCVWLWSVLVGGNSALTYTITNAGFERWGHLGFLFAILFIFVTVLVGIGWSELYKYANKLLIPAFLLRNDVGLPDRSDAATSLRRAFYAIIASILMRMAISVAQVLLTSFGD